MDLEVKLSRSLPPLVEGKIHGYLKLVIDEIVWSKRSPGNVTVLASWWGELDSAQFRPADIITNFIKSEQDTTELYAIKTNITLFEEYVKNCETIELIIISEDTNEVIGTAQVKELLNIFDPKPYFRYFPILNDNGNRIGEIHVAIKLLHCTKTLNMQLKTCKLVKNQTEDTVLLPANFSHHKNEGYKRSKKHIDNRNDFIKPLKSDIKDPYKPILSARRIETEDTSEKVNTKITDKLVAQVVARAQRLRSALLKETFSDDSLALSDHSMSDGFHNNGSAENEAKLYEYFLGKDMNSFDEHKALQTLKTTSPTPSLIDLATKTITTSKYSSLQTEAEKMPVTLEMSSGETTYNKSEETLSPDHLDNVRIFIESFTLSSAGYRRVKSSCLSRNDNMTMSVTYIVQYDTVFKCAKQPNKKLSKENKPIRIRSKKQAGEEIYFHHEEVYNIPTFRTNTNFPLKFKIFIQHLNQKLLVELGSGYMLVNNIAKAKNLTITHKVPIVNKGIKLGELKVTCKLHSNFIHLSKQYIDDIISTKENIPCLEMRSLLNTNSSKCKSATGTESKSNKVSSVSAKRMETLSSNNNADLLVTKDILGHEQNLDSKKVDIENPENNYKNKVLLHGLIYIAEGKDLPELNTYLICRAFWREDRAISQICSDTRNPSYHFCQLVPLIHGTDLLERIKDNYIIIEVYCKKGSGMDNLVGISKLPVHQLYVAYRDPLVLPHLLLSKYPIISVDGWVSINNPITGQSCGQLLALVALGTAEQIAFLEISRGLRNNSDFSPQSRHLIIKYDTSEPEKDLESIYPSETLTFHTPKIYEKELHSENFKTQESQTDISTVRNCNVNEFIQEEHEEEMSTTNHIVLNTLVNRLAHALNVNKANINQAAQTETNLNQKEQADIGEGISLTSMNCNSSNNSDHGSPKNNFRLPIGMYRSVGVGAEYDEGTNQVSSSNCNITLNSPTKVLSPDKEHMDSAVENSFRAVIEIECALHLPKIEKPNGSEEPSTYVTFQKHKIDLINRENSYITTNVCLYNCNPKWEWRCDTKLSTELLLNDEKRLILKIWRLFNPDINTQIELEKDIVIGFAAIDLSVLMAGFPTVSGWFHIIDFTGKCNGQIKVSITPLDNLASFAKSMLTINTAKEPLCNLSQSSWSPPYSYDMYLTNIEQSNTLNPLSMYEQYNEVTPVQSESQLNHHAMEVTHSIEDVSMSFLSSSLKQKLTELDEITKRLQSRLRDITNGAFEEDFENDFDLNEVGSDNENNDNKNVYVQSRGVAACSIGETSQIPHAINSMESTPSLRDRNAEVKHQVSTTNDILDRDEFPVKVNSGYFGSIQCHQNLTNGHCSTQQHNDCSSQIDNLSDISANYSSRGTKMHINHLLDKLSLQLPVKPRSSATVPVKRNIVDLLSNLKQTNTTSQDNIKCSRGVNVCSIPTQTDNVDNLDYQNGISKTVNSEIRDLPNDRNQSTAVTKPHTRISTVIREELIAEENDTSKCDELTTYLITSNVRHMDLDNILNPLLYQHLVPDFQLLNVVSPEEEAIEQLDNRYVGTFKTAINNGLSEIQNPNEQNAVSLNENSMRSRSYRSALESPENTEIFRLTPSGISENIDGNIDLTVVQKSSDNDLMASNSTESTTTASFEKSSIRHIEREMDENNYSISSDSSVSTTSRQAPDGGNPIEEVKKPVMTKQPSNFRNSSKNT